ncbi:MAG: 2-isopropylmalate synthase [Candidatus Gracilibacteria bacterium]
MNNSVINENPDIGVQTFGELVTNKYEIPRNSKFKLPDRTWPDNDIEKAPIWCSSCLRDGNQSIYKPMSVKDKMEVFNYLVVIGFKEIEVGFPSGSQADFDFVRKLIDEELIPDDVKIQVLVASKSELIEKTRKSLEGAKNVIVHLYNSTSTNQREVVFKKSKSEIVELAINGIKKIKNEFNDFSGDLTFQYSPESFTGTEMEFAEEITREVINEWGDFGGNPMILNFPATVENSTPNNYADKIEYFKRVIEEYRDKIGVILSIHTHNDRGSGVAATELALLAGADRVEGTLLGNGERTGNVDIITLGLNMATQGVDPKLNFADIGAIANRVSEIIGIPINKRHPYLGEFVHTAFSGGHQDAIVKGLKDQKKREASGNAKWEVPYLPIDPRDIGQVYEPIKINDQSGKGGVSYLLSELGYNIPKKMEPHIGRLFQSITDEKQGTLQVEEIKKIFEQFFVNSEGFISYDDINSEKIFFEARNNNIGIIEEFSNQLSKKYGIDFKIIDYHQYALTEGRDSQAVTYFEISINGEICYGFGSDLDIHKSAIYGLISTLNISNI